MKWTMVGSRNRARAGLLAVIASLASSAALAQLVVKEDFTGTHLNNTWTAINGACLTAGAGDNGSIPSCVGLPYYINNGDLYQVGGQNGYLGNTSAPSSNSAQTPDATGFGALRLTNGSPYYHESGAIVSTASFNATSGIQVTFKTVAYRGDRGGSGGDGADGISFFLLDASKYTAGSGLLGSWGGSLAYSCSNSNPPYTGQVGAYMGLGIDEYGNFLNGGLNSSGGYNDNTATGVAANGWGSGTYQWNRIGLRGAGNVAWSWLNANSPSNYPSSLTLAQQQAAVRKTCETGILWNYSVPATPVATATPVADYAPIPGASAVLSGVQIANETAAQRIQATPIYYLLKITNAGLLSLSYSYGGGSLTQVLTDQSITASNGNLPANLFFGFAGSTGGSNNVHEILCFQAAPADQNDASATVNLPLDKLVTNAQVYLPSYHTTNWWGELTAQYLSYSGYTLSISPVINWDAACVLGGSVVSTNTCTTIAGFASAQGPSSRTILSWNGTAGIGFDWSNLSASEKAALDPSVAASASDSTRLEYLRGDTSDEIPVGGPTATQIYRDRTSVMGDIVHSSPVWVGPPENVGYEASWSDHLYPAAVAAENASSAQNYQSFYNGSYGREDVVYVGANDGMLHGFRSGSYLAGQMVTTTYANDGREVVAYLPGAIAQTIHSANTAYDYSSPSYSHTYAVDATPRSDDLFYAGAWHTWLAGGLGAGGSAIYALDVTDPTQFSESNAGSLVVGEWTPSNLACSGNGACGAQLNNTFGTPVIWRFHAANSHGNNMWGMVFGNGFPNQITASTNTGFTASIGSTITGSIYSNITASINGTTLTVTAGSGITAGTVISGTGISAGTTITAQTGGTAGGAGTYTISTSLHISSETMTRSSTVLHVTAGNGIVAGETITGPGIASGTTIVSQLTGTAGSIGTYTVSIQQLVTSTNLQLLGTTLTVTAGGGLAPGQTITGTGVTAGTTIVSQTSGTTGGIGMYTVSTAQNVPLTLMTNGVSTLTVTTGNGVAVGQQITGAGVPAGTAISSMGSGTGGPGTYVINQSVTIASEQMSSINANATGTAGIYVMLVDPVTGGKTTYYLDTGYGPNQDPLGQGRANGIAYTAAADLDGDNTVDYVYGGDLFGNLWRFDLTSNNPASWAVSKFGNTGGTPLFSTTANGSSVGQPITTKPIVLVSTMANGNRGVIVNFGTGQEIPLTPLSPVGYAAGQQSLYGVWDWDMNNWNTLAGASLASMAAGTPPTPLRPANLTTQTLTVITTITPNEETDTNNTVCWAGGSAITGCTTYNQYGWDITLPGSVTTGTTTTYEQVIYNPTVWQGILQVNTTIPTSSTIYSCTVNLPTGWTLLINPVTGGSFTTSAFLDGSGNPITSGGLPVTGIQTNGTGSITNITVGNQNFWLTDTSNGTPTTGGEQAAATAAGHRVTWSELR
jgi:type IV pilus assembly protein PilY1